MFDVSNFLKLLELVKQNPNLPVFPIVSENICEFITEWDKDLITDDVVKKNKGKQKGMATG